MENWMFAIGFISQWAKANPKVPNIVVVLGVCVIGYFAYWISGSAAAVHTLREFLNGGFEWALRGVFALQGTSATASTLKNVAPIVGLPTAVVKALPITKG